MIDHPARDRIAEILVGRGRTGEVRTRGIGYLVSPYWVLTACHVVHDATSIGVWLGAPSMLTEEAGGVVDPGHVLMMQDADLALVPVAGHVNDPLCEPALFGRLGREPGPPVPVAAAGCPRFKLRSDPARPDILLRELHYAIGTIAGLSDAKSHMYTFAVEAVPGPDPEPDKHSPWEGMSGAAVWADGRLIGVVGKHYPQEGLGTLTVRPVEEFFRYASEAQLTAWRAALRQLPASAGNLWLATPPTSRKIEVAKARRAALDLNPRVLIGRGAELIALGDFTDSDLRWRWIQGDAFAGKTALLAWFTLHPPERVDVVACFLRRTTRNNAADYALDVLTRQLALLADRSGYSPPPFLSERAYNLVDLLDEATRASQGRGNRLLVLIDGLDEYDPTATSLDLAAWLPDARTLPSQAKLVVASRAGADIRLPKGHPLFGHLHHIKASEAATEIRDAAHRELDAALKATGGFASRVVCFLAAAGNGLTSSDLHVLLEQRDIDADVYEIEALLGSFLGRSLKRPLQPGGAGTPDPESADTQGWVFAHETLLAAARTLFADDLATYVELLDEWADEYAKHKWPIGTPRYLLRPYTRELVRRAREPSTGDSSSQAAEADRLATIGRLLRLAADPARHDRMLAHTGGDAASLAEINAVQQLLLAQTRPDLAALAILAFYQDRLIRRSSRLSPQLCAVFARLGYTRRAEQLARSLTYRGPQVQALAEVAAVVAETDPAGASRLADEAEQLAHAIEGDWSQAEALFNLATAAVQAGDYERAERLSRTIKIPEWMAAALGGLAGALAAMDSLRARRLADEAEKLVRSITDPGPRDAALQRLATTMAAIGDIDHAEQLVRSIEPSSWPQATALRAVVAALARSGRYSQAKQLADSITCLRSRLGALADLVKALAEADPDWSGRVADEAQQLAKAEEEAQQLAPGSRDLRPLVVGLAEIAAALAATDRDRSHRLADKAEQFARQAADPGPEVTLVSLAAALAAADPDRARRLAEEAEQLARDDAHAWSPTVPAELAKALAHADDHECAVELISMIPDRDARTQAMTELAVVVANAGEYNRAERLIGTITGSGDWATEKLAAALAHAGEYDRAERLIGTITGPRPRRTAKRELSTALSKAGQFNRAEQLARTIVHSWHRNVALSDLAVALARYGESDRAEQVAHSITTSQFMFRTLLDISAALAVSDPERALRIADEVETLSRGITSLESQIIALGNVSAALTEADPGRARRVADEAGQMASTIPDPTSRASTLRRLAEAAAHSSDYDRAEQIASTIEIPGERIGALADLAAALADVDAGRASVLADQAGHLAGDLLDTDIKAAAMLGIANVLTRNPHLPDVLRERACRFLAHALVSNSSWLEGLNVLAKLRPSVLPSIGSAILRKNNSLLK